MNNTLEQSSRNRTITAVTLAKTKECLAALAGLYVSETDLPHCYHSRPLRFGEQVMLERVAEIARTKSDALEHALEAEEQPRLLQAIINANCVNDRFDIGNNQDHSLSIDTFLADFESIPGGAGSHYFKSFVQNCSGMIQSACHELAQVADVPADLKSALISTFQLVRAQLTKAGTFSDFATLAEQVSLALPELIAAVNGGIPSSLETKLAESLATALKQSPLVDEISTLLNTSKVSAAAIAAQLKPGKDLCDLPRSLGLGQSDQALSLLGQVLSTAPDLAREDMAEARSSIAREVIHPLQNAGFTDTDIKVLVGVNRDILSPQAEKRAAVLSHVGQISFRMKRFPDISTNLAPSRNPNIWRAAKGASALAEILANEQREMTIICRDRGTTKIKQVMPKLMELYRAVGSSPLSPLCKDPAMVGAILLAFAEPVRETNGKREAKSAFTVDALKQRTLSVFGSLNDFSGRFQPAFLELVGLGFLSYSYPNVALNLESQIQKKPALLISMYSAAKNALAPSK